ncbi:MAG: hypothetical protein PHU71_01690 [Candidatus Gracilibacteria bacterium]|nr:hypothetical protein [Candidatus Gracilibacteria bacterium]
MPNENPDTKKETDFFEEIPLVKCTAGPGGPSVKILPSTAEDQAFFDRLRGKWRNRGLSRPL